MSQVMLIRMIADRAEIVVAALGAFPSNAKDRLLTTCIAHCAIVLDSGWCAVENSAYRREEGKNVSMKLNLSRTAKC